MSRPLPVLALAAAALSGCAIANPAAPAAPPSSPPRATATPAPSSAPLASAPAPVRLAIRYALTQATWTAHTWIDTQAKLAAWSTGRALAQLTPRDGQPPAAVAARLRAAHASSHATLIGTDQPAPRRVVVAYKITATGAGRNASRADYRIAHVTLTRHDGAWRVATFAIQP